LRKSGRFIFWYFDKDIPSDYKKINLMPAASSSTNWRDTLAHAEKIGVGTRDYELTRV